LLRNTPKFENLAYQYLSDSTDFTMALLAGDRRGGDGNTGRRAVQIQQRPTNSETKNQPLVAALSLKLAIGQINAALKDQVGSVHMMQPAGGLSGGGNVASLFRASKVIQCAATDGPSGGPQQTGGKGQQHRVSHSGHAGHGGRISHATSASAAPWMFPADGASMYRATPRWPLGGKAPIRGGFSVKSKKPRIMILMSDTGGGHRASAQALKAGFEHLYGQKYHIDIVDLWTHHTPWPYNEFPKSYSFMVKYPFIWRTNFTLTQPRFVHVPLSTAMQVVCGPSISAAFDKYRPNLIISVHPLMQHVPVRVLRRRIERGEQDPNTQFATVVTDLTTCHNTWFYSDVDRCFVATEESKQQALRLGMPEEKLRVYGLPIRPAFSHGLPPKATLKKRLGLDPKKPAIILMAGGEGMGPLEKTVNAVAKQIGAQAQLIVVCGRNAALVQRLRARKYPDGMRVNVQGFVTDMPSFLGASDVIITKAGPGTISEALICGVPMILNAFVPCQEEGNIPYVTENDVGVFETKPKKVAAIIKSWLEDNGRELKALSERAKALAKPDSLFDIVKELDGMVRAPSRSFA
jgi:1,2-diacylglycerol 3-beta-galactosyltransferase